MVIREMSSAKSSPRPSIKVDLIDSASCSNWALEELSMYGQLPYKDWVKFGETLKDEHLPTPLIDMLVYIAQEGVTTSDLFRRPGNPTDLRVITKKLSEGREVQLNNYNFYTLASVIKKFLLKIPGGILGPDVEKKLLHTLDKDQRMEQYDAIHSSINFCVSDQCKLTSMFDTFKIVVFGCGHFIISTLPEASQHLLALLFGTWFRIVNHSEFNAMSSEAVAKSVAGSLFHTCADDPKKIQKAVEVLQILIDDFGVANMFGRKNIQYFADMTRTGIKVREKFRYEYRYPAADSTQSAQRHLELFALNLQKEATRKGFHILQDAITEDEFYGRFQSRRGTEQSQESSIDLRLQPSPPSPASLQPHDNPDYNPHKKLTHVSSLSAPEVNKGYSPTQELSPAKRMYLSTSLNKFDNVKRRQMLLMKKRSNWFLTTQASTTATSMESESMMGSREASIGKSSKSSIDAISSEALSADVTASDGGISDGGARIPSDLDSTFDEASSRHESISTPHHVAPPKSDPLKRAAAAVHQDIVNGNHHKTSTPARSSSKGTSQTLVAPPWDSSSHSRSPSPNTGTGSSSGGEREVRYFMVENYYGTPEQEQQTES